MDPNNYTTQSANDTQRIKRFWLVAVIAVVVLAVIIIATQIHTSLTNGRLIITTNDPNSTITATPSPNDEKGGASQTTIKTQTLQSGQAATLSPGTYTVMVQGATGSTSRTVEVKAHQTSRYTINLNDTLSKVELVANTNARYLSVTPARITYVDLGDHNLNTIDASNQLARLGDLTYTSVHWADPSYGVGEDSTGLFHIIGNGSVTALSAPAPNANTPTLFSVAPNREIYLAIGTKIYHGSASQPFQAFYTADVAPTNIVASNNHVALIYNAGNTNSRQVSITMIDASGNKSSQNIEAYEGSWSPSGAYFATTSDSGTQIFDNSLRQVAAVPNKNVNNLTWLDDKTLFYSLNDRLWRFKLGSDQAEVIAAMDTNHAITEIAPSPDQSYIYLTAQNTAGSNNDLSVYRVGLKGQPVSDAVQQAAAHLPWLVGRCLLSLTNFTSPTIQSYGGQPEDNCPSVARRFVQSLGLDQTKFTYRETLVPPDVPVSQ